MKTPEKPYLQVGWVYLSQQGVPHLILRVSPNFDEKTPDKIFVGIPLVEKTCFDAFVFMLNGHIVSPKGNTDEVSPLNLDLSSGKSWKVFLEGILMRKIEEENFLGNQLFNKINHKN